MTRWAILTGEYPPQPGGVADYTRLVAGKLAAAGDAVEVYAPACPGLESADPGVTVHRLPGNFGPRTLRALDAGLVGTRPDRILIQYVPHAYGWKAMNLPFAAWVANRARRIAPVWVMAHEVVFPFAGWPPSHALLGGATALMARLVLATAERVFVSIPAWESRIRRLCPQCPAAEWLPIPSNVPAEADPEEVAAVRRRYGPDADVPLVGQFGTFGDPVGDVRGPAVAEFLARRPVARMLLVGRGTDRFARHLAAVYPSLIGRVSATGELAADRLSAHVRACDLMLQPYPDGVSSRRTSVMAGLANGVPVATNLGVLSEPLWARTTGVAVAASPDPVRLAAVAGRILDLSPADRAALGRRGAELYRATFTVERVIDALRGRANESRADTTPAVRATASTSDEHLPGGRGMGVLQKLIERLPASWIRRGSALRGRFPLVKRATNWMPNLLRNRDGRIRQGLGRGLRFNGGSSAVGFLLGTHDTDVQFALARLLRPGMTVYDFGANVGFTAVLAARCVGPTGRVDCFEPLSENAERIRLNAGLNGFDHVRIHQVALGDADGEADFRTSHAPTWGRLSDAGVTPEQSGVTRVPVRRLDSMVVTDGLPDPSLIKIDVEGAEAQVLTGARQLLARAGPVLVIELHHTYRAVVEALAGLDYTVRPLVTGGRVASLNGEFQLLAYPTGHAGGEALWASLEAGEKMVIE